MMTHDHERFTNKYASLLKQKRFMVLIYRSFLIAAVICVENSADAVEIIERYDGKKMLDHILSIEYGPVDSLICIAHLPEGLSEEQFSDLVSVHGEVTRKLLFMSEEFEGMCNN